jgi:hypothetical protein
MPQIDNADELASKCMTITPCFSACQQCRRRKSAAVYVVNGDQVNALDKWSAVTGSNSKPSVHTLRVHPIFHTDGTFMYAVLNGVPKDKRQSREDESNLFNVIAPAVPKEAFSGKALTVK